MLSVSAILNNSQFKTNLEISLVHIEQPQNEIINLLNIGTCSKL